MSSKWPNTDQPRASKSCNNPLRGTRFPCGSGLEKQPPTFHRKISESSLKSPPQNPSQGMPALPLLELWLDEEPPPTASLLVEIPAINLQFVLLKILTAMVSPAVARGATSQSNDFQYGSMCRRCKSLADSFKDYSMGPHMAIGNTLLMKCESFVQYYPVTTLISWSRFHHLPMVVTGDCQVCSWFFVAIPSSCLIPFAKRSVWQFLSISI